MTPAELDGAVSFWRFALNVQALITFVNSILVFIMFFRRKVPLDRELANLVKHSVCDTRRQRHVADLKEIRNSMDNRLQHGDELFRHIERSLGRIEGKIEEIKKAQ